MNIENLLSTIEELVQQNHRFNGDQPAVIGHTSSKGDLATPEVAYILDYRPKSIGEVEKISAERAEKREERWAANRQNPERSRKPQTRVNVTQKVKFNNFLVNQAEEAPVGFSDVLRSLQRARVTPYFRVYLAAARSKGLSLSEALQTVLSDAEKWKFCPAEHRSSQKKVIDD